MYRQYSELKSREGSQRDRPRHESGYSFSEDGRCGSNVQSTLSCGYNRVSRPAGELFMKPSGSCSCRKAWCRECRGADASNYDHVHERLSHKVHYHVPAIVPGSINVRPQTLVHAGSSVGISVGVPIVAKPVAVGGSCGLGASDSCGCGSGSLFPVLDPNFNLREVAKQLLLLEDHLFHEGKRCQDCIRKHMLTIEALLEEAITLDKGGLMRSEIDQYLSDFRNTMRPFAVKLQDKSATPTDYHVCAQQLRVIRKPLCVEHACRVECWGN